MSEEEEPVRIQPAYLIGALTFWALWPDWQVTVKPWVVLLWVGGAQIAAAVLTLLYRALRPYPKPKGPRL